MSDFGKYLLSFWLREHFWIMPIACTQSKMVYEDDKDATRYEWESKQIPSTPIASKYKPPY